MPVLNLSSKTLALDCENNEDVPDDSEEQYYEEPDLSEGVEGVDYDIIYGNSNEEPDTEAYNYMIVRGA
jgi:predicted transcriptional regulator YdeE